jgi:GBP family porin
MKIFLSALLATAVVLSGLPGTASAQSLVKLSGIVDVGVRADSGSAAGTISSLGSGIKDASRFTISGLEELGGGWKAGFVLESGFGTDTGMGLNNPPGVPAGAMSFGRLSALSIGSDDTGYLSLGRQYTPLWAVSAGPASDPFGAGGVGGIATNYSYTTRASNAVIYSYGYTAQTMLRPAPRKGLGAVAMWAPGEAVSPAARHAGDQLGVNLSYGDGIWWLGYAYHQAKGASPSTSATAPVSDQPKLMQQTLAMSYQFPFGRLHLGFNTGKNDAVGALALDRLNWHLGATLPLAENQTLRLFYGRANDRTAVNADFHTVQIGYDYDLSKRTTLYTGFGKLDNNDNASATLIGALGTYAKGSHSRSVVAGIRHLF